MDPAHDQIAVEFELSQQELNEAAAVHRRSYRGTASPAQIMMFIAALLLLALAASLSLVEKPGEFPAYVVIALIGTLLLTLVAATFMWARRPRAFAAAIERRVLAESRGRSARWVLDGQGLTVDYLRLRAHMKWEAVRRATESENLFLLYTGEHDYAVLPKRACTAEQLIALRALIETSLSAPIGAFPVVMPETR